MLSVRLVSDERKPGRNAFEEIYDLVSDPFELDNRVLDPDWREELEWLRGRLSSSSIEKGRVVQYDVYQLLQKGRPLSAGRHVRDRPRGCSLRPTARFDRSVISFRRRSSRPSDGCPRRRAQP